LLNQSKAEITLMHKAQPSATGTSNFELQTSNFKLLKVHLREMRTR
jgi:hypothetical protein